MDTRHMRYFLALAETLNFGRAAARMHMTQPPFSRQIANLEAELGARLFERNSRSVTLTVAGQRFLVDTRQVLSQFDAACRDARLVAEGKLGELRLGFMMHAAHSIVPRMVRLYSERRPDVRLSLEETIPTAISDLLRDGRLDAAVTFDTPGLPAIQSILLHRERLRLIVPRGHELADAATAKPSDLADLNLIATPATVAPSMRAAIEDYCRSGGRAPVFVLEPMLQQTIIRLVAEGLGAALVPETLCTDLPEAVRSLTLVDPPQLDMVLAFASATKNPAVAALIEIARDWKFSRIPTPSDDQIR